MDSKYPTDHLIIHYKGERCVSKGEAELAAHTSPKNQVTNNETTCVKCKRPMAPVHAGSFP